LKPLLRQNSNHRKACSPGPRSQSSNKRWLPPVFDCQYFNRIGRIPYTTLGSCAHETNPDVCSSLGNLPSSSAIASRYPENVRHAQEHNLSAAPWEKRVLGCAAAPDDDPFEFVLTKLMAELSPGKHEDVCGLHAFVGALDDEATYVRAPRLSQVVACIVQSIKIDDGSSSFTRYAIMHQYWTLFRWMLNPTRDTYRAIPDNAKPTPYQLFVPHARTFDFLVQPALRDLMCRNESPDVRWLTDGAATIHCEWSRDTNDALCRDGRTTELDLNPIAKVSLVMPNYQCKWVY
jgi:hypothetical protein